jgi:hypothetical protein
MRKASGMPLLERMMNKRFDRPFLQSSSAVPKDFKGINTTKKYRNYIAGRIGSIKRTSPESYQKYRGLNAKLDNLIEFAAGMDPGLLRKVFGGVENEASSAVTGAGSGGLMHGLNPQAGPFAALGAPRPPAAGVAPQPGFMQRLLGGGTAPIAAPAASASAASATTAADAGGELADAASKRAQILKRYALPGAIGAAGGLGIGMALNNNHNYSSRSHRLIEFAGGYVQTDEGVKKERGIGAHFNRAAGRYIGGSLLFPIGIAPGYVVDRVRRKHNIKKTEQEPNAPWFSKGPIEELSTKLDNLIEFGADPRPRNQLGMFTQGQEGGPDPNAMVRTYHMPPPQQQAPASGTGVGNVALTAAIAGATGTAATLGIKELVERLKKVKAANLTK